MTRTVWGAVLVVVGLVMFAVGVRAMLAHKEWTIRVNPGRYLAIGGFFVMVVGVLAIVGGAKS